MLPAPLSKSLSPQCFWAFTGIQWYELVTPHAPPVVVKSLRDTTCGATTFVSPSTLKLMANRGPQKLFTALLAACCCYILSEPSAKEPIKTASFRLSLLGTLLSKENNFYTPSTPRKVVHKLDRNHRRTCQDLFLQSAQETKTPVTGFIDAKVTFFQPNKESSQQFICQLGAEKGFFSRFSSTTPCFWSTARRLRG